MKDFNFDDIIYIPMNTYTEGDIEIIGVDSESYQDGTCFLFGFSDGTYCEPAMFFYHVFSSRYDDCCFTAYNLKYEIGSVLQQVHEDNLRELAELGITKYSDIIIELFGYKAMILKRKKKRRVFYDCLQFYNMSLNEASKRYLGKEKIDIDVLQFSLDYVQKNYDRIVQYCIQDAKLCAELLKKIKEFSSNLGVKPKRFYSPAYIAFHLVSKECKHQPIKRYWEKHRDLLKAFSCAYHGGKFEVTQRGFFPNAVKYDINSAYPAVIADLDSIEDTLYIRKPEVCKYSLYSAYFCRVEVYDHVYHSISYEVLPGLVIYPMGIWYTALTKHELEHYIKHNGIKIDILDAYHIIPSYREFKPYKRLILQLYRLKEEYKKQGDIAMSKFVKLMLNSIYGKFVQVTKKRGKLVAGWNWNIIYGSEITARVRLQLAKLQQKYQDKIIAVHTDSVIATTEIPDIKLSNKLGDWKLEGIEDCLMVGTGVYVFGKQEKKRGRKY